MPRVTRPSSSGRSLRFSPIGSVAWNPAIKVGVTTMKMMSSTSITSTIGVTLMSPRTVEVWFALSDEVSRLISVLSVAGRAGRRHPRGGRALPQSGRTGLHALLEDEQEVEELLRAVVDLHRDE